MGDITEQLIETVQQALVDNEPLNICGSGSKEFLRLSNEGKTLSTLKHCGIVSYEPTELVVTVRAGTSIAELEQRLSDEGQMLAFEPPIFSGGTIGGAIASGLSGPRRPWAGAARDFVLGTRIINGKGEDLKFGGQVMKNVAGYDVSRLMVGAYGVLGLIHEISLKVLPSPECEVTQMFEQTAEEFIRFINKLSGKPTPLSAACWYSGRSMVRLSGTEAGVHQAVKALGGDTFSDEKNFWMEVRNQKHAFFRDAEFWRLSVPPATQRLEFTSSSSTQFIDWGGAQRWIKTTDNPEQIREMAKQANGYAEQWHSADKAYLRSPLDSSIEKIHRNIKQAFDPEGIFNPGVFYPYL